ncbi:hypothetical protein EUGRSUZ_J03147 [Eucalyptus grandis]|uniref:Uncharacterized protein n=2 Tax=Eucalyptus grandis TaxID=71139 RepID=A0ACC3JAS4_EUCGR|nr:hypothetical protein EUGRSUZ_J03147 [Eucalyptus grandis]
MASSKVQRIMTQPINLIFRFLQSVSIPVTTLFLGTIFRVLFCPILRRDNEIIGNGFADVHSVALLVVMQKARIQIWLFEQKDLRIEGRIIGFDEYMNLVLDDAEEVNVKKKTRKTLGRILLKGDNITLMMNSGK